MSDRFSEELEAHVKQARLPIRRLASDANIPHQTLFNWINGTRPRWHPALRDDLCRLAMALGLDNEETEQLLQLAGCLSAGGMKRHTKESAMVSSPQLPKNWLVAGSHPTSYEMGVDHSVTYESNASAYIKSRDGADGFGTLMQQFKSDQYRGRRLRLAAVVRAENVDNWAGLWMRVDGHHFGEMLAFDNMESRPITGTSDWTPYSVVLDVAESSEKIAFGILLGGRGEVWMADVRLEPVGHDVATTDRLPSALQPTNLDFSE